MSKKIHRGKNHNMKVIHLIVREKWIYRKQRWHGHGNKALEFTTLPLWVWFKIMSQSS